MKNIAVILSGGSGSRMKNSQGIPKQYLNISNKMVIEHTITVFQNNKNIDEIFVVAEPKYHNLITDISKKNNFTKVTKILNSGKTRNESSWSAISICESLYKNCNLLIHDAVRPFISSEIINECINSLDSFNAVCVAEICTDTILIKNNISNCIKDIPNRNFIYNAQTPQCFKLSTIYKAYKLLYQNDNIEFTDNCGLIKKYLPKEKIYIVNGSHKNIKITFEEDLIYAEMIMNMKNTSDY